MTFIGTHPGSPFAQVNRLTGLPQTPSSRPLSAKEQAAVKRSLTEGYDHIHHELFDRPTAEAEQRIFDAAPPIPEPGNRWSPPVTEQFGATRAPQDGVTVRLRRDQERALFLQFNYCRYRVNQGRAELAQQAAVDPRAARRMLRWRRRAEGYRDRIVRANMGLVPAMIQRAGMWEAGFADLVGEGNMALLRAVDKFDVSRGFKFSTYACRAILQAFGRRNAKDGRYRQMFPAPFEPGLEKPDGQADKHEAREQRCLEDLQRILRDNRAELSGLEQEVIRRRFLLDKPPAAPDRRPPTLEQLGRMIGLTKERVRQIQHRALSKLHAAMQGTLER